MVDFRTIEGRADFYFIRHGESVGNREKTTQGRQLSPLTDLGRSQAREAGQWFRGRGIAAVLTSPLDRAQETAEILASEASLGAPEVVGELTELDTGLFTGLSLEQAAEQHPEAWRAFLSGSWEGVPGAERIADLYDRAMRVWAMLFARRRSGETAILCVTHSGFLQWIVKTTVGHRRWMPLFSAAGNCCVSHLRVDNRALGGGATALMANWLLLNLPVQSAPVR